MKQIKLLLAPQPGAKPEYLDDVSLYSPSPVVLKLWNEELPREPLLLEAYTRDAWAWKPNNAWTTVTVASATGRNKLAGFTDYLKQRQKSCFGRFAPRGVLVVSYTQPSSYTKSSDPFRMDCRIVLDMAQIPKCNLKPLGKAAPTVGRATASNKPATAVVPRKKGGGLLGKLVGAQQRTNHHVAVATVKRSAPVIGNSSANVGGLGEGTATATTGIEARTAQQVLNDFRQSMQDKMLNFDLDQGEEKLEVKLSVGEHTAGLSVEDKSRVTMEILKYMVYEAAEEVNEEWVAHKEPSEFMDEAIIAVYKEGAAPPEVLEEVNKGELPDEVRGQQRAIEQQRHRQVNQAESKHKQLLESDAHRYEAEDAQNDDFAVLNTNKRDRRSVEDYEREKAKKGRTA